MPILCFGRLLSLWGKAVPHKSRRFDECHERFLTGNELGNPSTFFGERFLWILTCCTGTQVFRLFLVKGGSATASPVNVGLGSLVYEVHSATCCSFREHSCNRYHLVLD
jgi:hypothetical protein